jgi:hypothetical protein
MGRKYRPGSGIGAAIAFFGMTVYLVYKLSFDTVHNLFGENVEEILLLISVIGGVIIGKQIYRLMVRNLGEDRAANLDFKIYKTTITTVILVALFILLKNHRRLLNTDFYCKICVFTAFMEFYNRLLKNQLLIRKEDI